MERIELLVEAHTFEYYLLGDWADNAILLQIAQSFHKCLLSDTPKGVQGQMNKFSLQRSDSLHSEVGGSMKLLREVAESDDQEHPNAISDNLLTNLPQ